LNNERARQSAVADAPMILYFLELRLVFLVGQYFTDPNIIIPVILSIIPWSLMVIPFKGVAGRVVAGKNGRIQH
jgi:hypothetical protein